MPTFDYDARFISAGLDQLDSYLLSSDIYRPVGASAPSSEPPYPQLTLGALLLAQKRAEATALSPAQKAEFSKLQNILEAKRSRWRSAWGRKATAEFRARLNLWGDFLNEYRKHPDANNDRFAYEVSRRVILHLLRPEAIDLPKADLKMVDSLDALLQVMLVPAGFIWDDSLIPAFPASTYWYLYGYLPKKINQTTTST